MATLSVVNAVLHRIRSFTAIPQTFAFDTPTSVDNAQKFAPYIVIMDDGTDTSYPFELTVMEVTNFTVMIYAESLNDVDDIVEKVKYNGGGIAAGLGLDFGPLAELAVAYSDMAVQRLSENRFLAVATGRNAERVSGCQMKYRVTLYRYSAN